MNDNPIEPTQERQVADVGVCESGIHRRRVETAEQGAAVSDGDLLSDVMGAYLDAALTRDIC